MVDIFVEALYDAPNLIDMIRGIIPGLQSQPDERPPNSMVIPSRGIRKFKHSFKSLRIHAVLRRQRIFRYPAETAYIASITLHLWHWANCIFLKPTSANREG